MALAPDDPRPPYQQIADDLRQAIRSGDLAPGDQLPSNRQLMDQYGVAPQTVQSAFRMLKDEQLTYSVQGRGTYVRTDAAEAGGDSSPEDLAGEVDALRGELARFGARLDALAARVEGLDDGS